MIQIIQRRGRTILFSSHVLGDVERVADRVGVMVDGVLRVDCPAEHFKRSIRKVIAEFGRDLSGRAGRQGELANCQGLLGDWSVGSRARVGFRRLWPGAASRCRGAWSAANRSGGVEPRGCVHRLHARAASGLAAFLRCTKPFFRRAGR